MDIRRRDDRLADAHCVGQGPRGDLRRIEIRRRVDVCRLQIVDELVMLEKRIDEFDVAADPEIERERLQLVAILLAFVCDEVRMRRTQHGVEHVWVLLDDRGQRIDHHFDALARREQAEGQDDVAPFPAKARLERVGIDELAIGNTVRDHHDRPAGCTINALEDLTPTLGHDDDARRATQQAFHHATLIGVGLFEDRVERDDHRHRHALEQGRGYARPLRRRKCRIRVAATTPAHRSPRSRARLRDTASGPARGCCASPRGDIRSGRGDRPSHRRRS